MIYFAHLLLLPLHHVVVAQSSSASTVSLSDGNAAANACTCFKINASDPSVGPQLFTGYSFLDFRNLASSVSDPAIVDASQNDGSGDITADYFNSDKFTSSWAIQTWTQPKSEDDPDTSTVDLANSPQNVFIGQDDSTSPTYLTLRTARLDPFQSAAEIDTPYTFTYASFRARMRVTGDAGGVAGLFFYNSDTSESDLEILTRDAPNIYHASNQPDVDDQGDEIPNASTEEPVSDFTVWNEYRLDWVPGLSVWMINGQFSTSKAYGVPTGAATADLNMWGNGGTWSGNMSVGAEARMELEWVQVVFNGTGDGNCDSSTAVICDVDSTGMVGQLSVVNTGVAHRVSDISVFCLLIVIVSVFRSVLS